MSNVDHESNAGGESPLNTNRSSEAGSLDSPAPDLERSSMRFGKSSLRLEGVCPSPLHSMPVTNRPSRHLPRPLHTNERLHHRAGHLEKQGEWFSSFKPRYVKLYNEGVFAQYLTEEDQMPRARQPATLVLCCCSQRKTVVGSKSHHLSLYTWGSCFRQ